MPELNVLRGLLTGLLLTASTLAVPVKPASSHDNTPTHPGATCATFTVPVSVSLNNSIFSGPRVDNNIDAVNFVWDADAWDHPAGPARIVGSVLVQETYNVEAQLCVPLASAGNKREILQVATHGGAFDKRSVPPKLNPAGHWRLQQRLAGVFCYWSGLTKLSQFSDTGIRRSSQTTTLLCAVS